MAVLIVTGCDGAPASEDSPSTASAVSPAIQRTSTAPSETPTPVVTTGTPSATPGGDERLVVRDGPVHIQYAVSPCWPPSSVESGQSSAGSARSTAGSLQWSPDGSKILFVASHAAEVYAVASDGSRVWRIAKAWAELTHGQIAGREVPFDIAPDGARLAYATCEFPPPGRESHPDIGQIHQHDLMVARLDGTERQRLTTSASFENFPAWSPDGSHIAFVASNAQFSRIRLIRSDGANERSLRGGFDHVAKQPPRWSPDGRWLAVTGVSAEGNGRWALHLINVRNGDDFIRLSDAVSGASWSPDGTRLAFARPDGAGVAIYTIAADGTDAQRVTKIEGWRPRYGAPDPTRAWIESISWSPDGKHILYTCASAICVVSLDGTPGSSAPLPGEVAAWSPDGSRIAVASSKFQLLVQTLALDGSDVRTLVVQGKRGSLQSADDLRQSEIAACGAGNVVPNPVDNPDLVRACETLLRARGALRGTAELNWTSKRPLDQWDGLDFSGWPRQLVAISLNGRRLTGGIPPELGELKNLRRLELSGNSLGGAIPTELGQSTQLLWLDLSDNSLTGGIPRELGALTQLTELHLSNNNLEGVIPPALGGLVRLVSLRLDNNKLTGPIPPEMGELKNLRRLELSGNSLGGAIPTELGQLTLLVWLDLSDNSLTGGIPRELGALTQLIELHFSNNNLEGVIPPALGGLVLLESLRLDNNKLTGPIPLEVGQFAHLKRLNLGGNELTGCVTSGLLGVRLHDISSLELPACEPG